MLGEWFFNGLRERAWEKLYRARDVPEHDYRRHTWGHSCSFKPEEGRKASAVGWGPRGGGKIRKDDVLVLDNGAAGARYRVMEIEYYRDPRDMWRATLRWYPHPDNMDRIVAEARIA